MGGKIGESLGTGDWLGALLGGAVTWLTASDSIREETSYEVWECPGCHCEVLYRTIREEGPTKTSKLIEISDCKNGKTCNW
ncbi:hypothetical protein KSC_093330 [Ktedonobacter sp. SOSP1-52]|nr:hypothetical protein KSC_093330 [Ktedonobacter sp. SOSP1-52]